jgi:DNA polymerase III epsilon subunit-like protein
MHDWPNLCAASSGTLGDEGEHSDDLIVAMTGQDVQAYSDTYMSAANFDSLPGCAMDADYSAAIGFEATDCQMQIPSASTTASMERAQQSTSTTQMTDDRRLSTMETPRATAPAQGRTPLSAISAGQLPNSPPRRSPAANSLTSVRAKDNSSIENEQPRFSDAAHAHLFSKLLSEEAMRGVLSEQTAIGKTIATTQTVRTATSKTSNHAKPDDALDKTRRRSQRPRTASSQHTRPEISDNDWSPDASDDEGLEKTGKEKPTGHHHRKGKRSTPAVVASQRPQDNRPLLGLKIAVFDAEVVPGPGQELVEVAVKHVAADGSPTRPPYHTLVDPQTPMLSYKGESETPITDEMLLGKPIYAAVHDPLMAELQHADFVASYQAVSDAAFVEKAVVKAGRQMPRLQWICLLKVMKFLVAPWQLKKGKTYAMPDMCDHFGVPKQGADHRAFNDATREALLLLHAFPLLAEVGVTTMEHMHVQVLKTDECSERQQKNAEIFDVHAAETKRQHDILRAQLADVAQQKIWAEFISDEAFLDHITKNSKDMPCIFGSERAGGALLVVRRSSATFSNKWVSGVPSCPCLQMVVWVDSNGPGLISLRTPDPDGPAHSVYFSCIWYIAVFSSIIFPMHSL